MIGADASGRARRSAVAILAAYGLLLHALAIDAMAARVGGAPALFPICQVDASARRDPGVPTRPDDPHDHSDCTLCGSSHGGLALPAEVMLPGRGAATPAGIVAWARACPAPLRHRGAAQPRGPPRPA